MAGIRHLGATAQDGGNGRSRGTAGQRSWTAMVTTALTRARPATAEDLPHLAQTLAAAFLDDPVLTWCYPDPALRSEILPRFFAVIGEVTLADGGIYTTDDVVAGAVWVHPGVDTEGDRLVSRLEEISAEYAPRLLQLLELIDGVHPSETHHYLFVLGTRPRWQSRGIGSALMAPVLEICDQDGTPAYLEASSERNKRLYLRHGFEVTQELRLPEGPPLWCMWRAPAGRN
jgi:GNAT superfamily N-acetyltransferase